MKKTTTLLLALVCGMLLKAQAPEPKLLFIGIDGLRSDAFQQADTPVLDSLRDTGLTKLNEDIVVPRGKLEALFRFTAGLQRKYRIPVACFGHAGDGNIHCNVMLDTSDAGQRARADECLDALFRGILAMGGVVTGEHGIGLAKRPWWKSAVSPEAEQLHQTIKKALDPSGVLNPGKFLSP